MYIIEKRPNIAQFINTNNSKAVKQSELETHYFDKFA